MTANQLGLLPSDILDISWSKLGGYKRVLERWVARCWLNGLRCSYNPLCQELLFAPDFVPLGAALWPLCCLLVAALSSHLPSSWAQESSVPTLVVFGWLLALSIPSPVSAVSTSLVWGGAHWNSGHDSSITTLNYTIMGGIMTLSICIWWKSVQNLNNEMSKQFLWLKLTKWMAFPPAICHYRDYAAKHCQNLINILIFHFTADLSPSRRVTVWMWKVVLLSGEADGATPSSPCLNQYLFQMVSGNLFGPLLMYLVPYLSVSSWFIKQFNTFHSKVDTKLVSFRNDQFTKINMKMRFPWLLFKSPRTWGWGMMAAKLLGPA